MFDIRTYIKSFTSLIHSTYSTLTLHSYAFHPSCMLPPHVHSSIIHYFLISLSHSFYYFSLILFSLISFTYSTILSSFPFHSCFYSFNTHTRTPPPQYTHTHAIIHSLTNFILSSHNPKTFTLLPVTNLPL